MARLKDIAAACDLSVTQVSRALSGYSDVSEETRQRVRQMADRLGYRSNTMARGLKTGRSGMVAMVMPPQIDGSTVELMFEIITGISSELVARGMRLVLHVVTTEEDVLKAYDELGGGGGIDAFVLVEPRLDDKRISHLLRSRIPFVVHGSDPCHVHTGVSIDNAGVASRMVEELAVAGHRRIAHLNGTAQSAFASDRDSGYLSAVADAGLIDVGRDLSFGDMTQARGEKAFRALWARPTRPTALVLGNTMLARGVYSAARALGVSIPGDVSVLAHDDGLETCLPRSFDPVVGGTRSYLSKAWAEIGAMLSDGIPAPGSPASRLVVEVEFAPGASVAPPAETPGDTLTR